MHLATAFSAVKSLLNFERLIKMVSAKKAAMPKVGFIKTEAFIIAQRLPKRIKRSLQTET